MTEASERNFDASMCNISAKRTTESKFENRIGKVVVLQKGVSHYRQSIFMELFLKFGWTVAAGSMRGGSKNFARIHQAIFLKPIEARIIWNKPRIIDLSLRNLLKRGGPDVIIAEFSMYLTSTYKLALGRVLTGRPKLVFHTHGFNMERGHHGLLDRLMDWLRLQIIDRADAIACYSEEGRDYLARYLRPEKLFVTRNTIDIAPMRALREVAPHRHGDGLHLLAVGRMTRDKRFPELVGLFRRVLAAVPDAHLTVVGDGPDMPAVREAAGDLLGRSVHLPGLVYDEPDLAPLFMAADLFVVTGAAGLGINHALAYGLPVVAFRRTAQGPFHHPEICYVVDGVTGWLVDEFDDGRMADRIIALVREHPRPRAALGTAIDRYVDDNLTLEHLVEDFHRVYRYVAALPTSRRRS